MSHNYLLDTYAYIHQRLDAARQQSTTASDDPQRKQFAEGRIETLCQFERFLSDHYDARLPRRLARQRSRMEKLCASTS